MCYMKKSRAQCMRGRWGWHFMHWPQRKKWKIPSGLCWNGTGSDTTFDNKDETGAAQFPYCENDQFYGLDPLQVFGLNTCWSISNPNPETEYDKEYNALVNKGSVAIAGYDRWPNYGLAVVLTGEAAENQALLKDWVANAELEFVTGVRSFEDWDAYVEEWIDKGGEAILEQTAECLGCEMPEF